MFHRFFVLLFLGVSLSTSAQRIDDRTETFNYIQLPLQPLGPSISSYTSRIDPMYLDKIAEEKAQYQRALEQAEYTYQDDLRRWENDKRVIDEEYAAAVKAYDEKSSGTKIVEGLILDEYRPVKRPYPPRPYKHFPQQIATQKELNISLLTETVLQLDGYTRGGANAVHFTVQMDGFEVGQQIIESVNRRRTINGERVTVTSFFYSIEHRHPVSLRVEADGLGILHEGYLPALSEYTVYHSKEFPNEAQLESWWRANEKQEILSMSDAIGTYAAEYTADWMNSQYGYASINRQTVIYKIKDKKGEYEDLNEAYELAKVGYSRLANNDNKTAAKEVLAKALALYERAMKESLPEDKKARVNAKVTAILGLNMAEVYIFMDRYEDARAVLQKVKDTEVKRFVREIDVLNSFLEDQEARFRANH